MTVSLESENIFNKDLLKMPIDQFGRYYVVSSVIKELAALKQQKQIRILDVGGYNGSLTKFFPEGEAHITVLDMYDSEEPNYVKGNALELPFEDNSFDYVVSFEVFEHIPRKDRQKYISEAVRVAEGPFILTAPFSGANEEVSRSEVLVNDLWKHIHKQDHEWLKEHILYKTPKTEELEKIIKSHKLAFTKTGNNDLLLWNLMQSLSFLTTLYRSSGNNEKAQEFYNNNISLLESGEDNFYRYIYLIGDDANRKLKSLEPLKDDEKKEEKKYELINKVFISISDDFKKITENNNKIINENNKLTHKLNQSRQEIEQIKNSVTWQLAKRLSTAGKAVPGKRVIKKWIKK